MLSRSGSTTSSNLPRTRSTTSVKERRKHPLQAHPIDPQTARTHALIAAHRALDRSRSSKSTEVVQPEGVLSTQSISSSHGQDVSCSPGTHLRRQRSTLQLKVPKLANSLEVREPHRMAEPSQKHFDYETYFKIPAEKPATEYSSYRKLRKSKSLMTPIRRIEHVGDRSPETSLSQAPTLRPFDSSPRGQSPGLRVRLQKSLSFLRQPYKVSERVLTAPVQLPSSNQISPEAVSLARTQYLEDLSSHRPQDKSLVLFSSKARPSQKTFRKSVRTGITPIDRRTTTDGESASTWKQDKRSVSASLSSKVKKIFGRAKQEDVMPPQQLEASKAHFGEYVSAANSEAGFDSYMDTEFRSTNRPSLYVPSNLHPEFCDEVAQLPEQLGRSSSPESLSSTSRSRVTSWTNSTTTGSVTIRPTTTEPKRLSVIKEDGGPHQPSSSAGRHIGGVSLFQQPLQVPDGRKIDSQRVYSALLKRIDEDQKEMEKTQAALKEIHDAREQDNIVGHYLFSTPSIRRVESEAPPAAATGQRDKVPEGSRTAAPDDDQRVSHAALEPSQNVTKSIGSSATLSGFSTLTKKPRSVRRSPFRQYLDEKKSASELGIYQKDDCENNSALTDPTSTSCYYHNASFGQSTDSIYSRTTNGGTNPDYVSPLASMESLSQPEPTNNNIDTVLLSTDTSSNTVNRIHNGPRTPQTGPIAKKGSWRDWMDHQMEDLESKSRTKSTKHFREHAQTDPEDTQVGQHTSHAFGSQVSSSPTPIQGLRERTLRTPSIDSLLRSNMDTVADTAPPPSLQLKKVRQNPYPAYRTSSSIRRSKSALLDRTNQTEGPTSMQKISPGHVAVLLKTRKSQPTLTKSTNLAKENIPVRADDSPPVSTPGRYSVRMQSVQSTSRLPKGSSTSRLQQTWDSSKIGRSETATPDSPSCLLKSSSSARLSRPFDMDIPDRNRPFDSTYLGKREIGSGSRLSVASNSRVTRHSKTYGGLGPPPITTDEDADMDCKHDSVTTALPILSNGIDSQRSTSGHSLVLVGQRLVSTFLKSRSKQANEGKASASGSPAFL